jgi:lipooligosaccharide transport system permease protein
MNMSTTTRTTLTKTTTFASIVPPITAGRRPWRLVERNVLAYRRMWFVFLSGFAEPILFMLSIGVGVGELVGDLQVGSQVIDYQAFVAPGLLAVAAMNGAALDTTFNFFVKYKYSHTYDAVLATPVGVADVAVGEVVWALLRGAVYSTGFLVTMLFFGVVESWWAVRAVPAAILIGFGFAGAGLACTTYMRSFMDFDYVNLVLVPLFLFSATFFPLSRYPAGLEAIIRLTPLYQGVALERSLVFGDLHWSLLANAAYLFAMGWIGVSVASKRIGRLLQP